MDKRGKKVISLFEIFLMISVSFAISFLLSENFVSSQSGVEGAADFVPPSTLPGPSAVGTSSLGNPVVGSTTGGVTGGISNLFGGTIWTGAEGVSTGTTLLGNALLSGLAWAAVAFAVVKLITSLLGVDKGLANALSYAAAE